MAHREAVLETSERRLGLCEAEILPTNISMCLRRISRFRNPVVDDRYRPQPSEALTPAWDIFRCWRRTRH